MSFSNELQTRSDYKMVESLRSPFKVLNVYNRIEPGVRVGTWLVLQVPLRFETNLVGLRTRVETLDLDPIWSEFCVSSVFSLRKKRFSLEPSFMVLFPLPYDSLLTKLLFFSHQVILIRAVVSPSEVTPFLLRPRSSSHVS